MTRFNWGTTYKGVDDYFLAVSQGSVLLPFIPKEQEQKETAAKFVPFIPKSMHKGA